MDQNLSHIVIKRRVECQRRGDEDGRGGGVGLRGSMKRKRGGMEKSSEITSAIELLSLLKPDGHISTMPFLSICSLVLQVLDKIGPTMSVLRHDIHENIQRLEKKYDSDPSTYSTLLEIVRKEVGEGSARKVTSCTRAVVWLTRSMDFAVALLKKVAEESDKTLEQAVEESYEVTLKPWHGWISSAAYRVALKLIPERKSFAGLLMAEGEDTGMLMDEIKSLIALLLPVLDEIHTILNSFGSDRLRST